MARIRNEKLAAPPEAPAAELAAARPVDLRKATWIGVVGGVTVSFIAAVGMLVSFDSPRLATVGGITFGYVMLALIPLIGGYLAGRPPPVLEGFAEAKPGGRNVVAGLLAGTAAGGVAGLFAVFTGNVDIRSVFVNVSPAMVQTLTFGLSLPVATALLISGGIALGALGGSLHRVPAQWRGGVFGSLVWVVLFGLMSSVFRQIIVGTADLTRFTPLEALDRFIYNRQGGLTAGGVVLVGVVAFAAYYLLGAKGPVRRRVAQMPDQSRRRWKVLAVAVAVVAVAFLPWIIGTFLSRVLVFAGIFLLMALGLNIVVGFAGLLDLGYVAFFAVGAYATAVLTSPLSPALAVEMTFWMAIPFVVMAGALAGLMVGTPVLRMRGDYLAIVTLGFGEIARLLFLSDALKDTFGGAQGITRIPDVSVFGVHLGGNQRIFYVILLFVIVAAYVSWSLQDSRIGRAWMAMREDQSVAEATGVNYVSAKLWAFVIGAILGGFGGALFATNISTVSPASFDVVVSITVLVVIIVGGLGSLPGVIVGALVIVALPQFLREFEEFRFLLYGALLIVMMLNRPEGLIPSRRRAAELHEEEVHQDAWLKKQEEQGRRAEAGQEEDANG